MKYAGRALAMCMLSLAWVLPTRAQNMMTKFYNANGVEGPVNRGDFNQDGISDVIFGSGQGVGVALINPDGTVRTQKFSQGNVNSQDLAVGSFTHSGHLDAVISALGTQEVDVMLGNGDGTFRLGQTLMVPPQDGSPSSITAGDFNHDGNQDIAVGTQTLIVIYPGQGDGTFGSPAIVSTPIDPNFGILKIRSGDFDRDGKADIAVFSFGEVLVMFNNGQFNFVAATVASNPYNLDDMTPTDINQDGYTDLLISSHTTCPPPPSNVSCNGAWDAYVSNGRSRTFRDAYHQELGSDFSFGPPRSMYAADVDGDGINDTVATIVSGATRQVIVWKGLPNGQFSATPMTYNTGTDTGTFGLVPLDLNRDGRPDFAVTNLGDSSFATLINAVPRASCANSTVSPSVTVCMPSDVAYVNSPMHVVAKTTDTAHAVTAIKIYVDNRAVYTAHSGSLDTTVSMSLGAHFVVVQAFDSSGATFRSDRNITVYSGAAGQVCSTDLNSLRVCLPQQHATVRSPVRVFAAAYDDRPATAVQVYVDGHLKYNDRSMTDYLDQGFAMSAGPHLIVAKTFDATGRSFSVSRNVTVH